MKEMSRNIDEKELQKLNDLLEILKDINLDFNWLLAVTSLSAGEIAIKKRLDELGVSYGEEDFQKLAEELQKAMEAKKLEVPHILLSIARSYRHIRAKVMHDPHKARLNIAESDAILHNTGALVATLFKRKIEQIDISKFMDSIERSSLNEKVKEFKNFEDTVKIQVFETIMNKISLFDWEEFQADKSLFDFLRAALKAESSNIILQKELFNILLTRTMTGGPKSVSEHEKLLAIIAEFTRLGFIKDLIRERGYMNSIVAEYEMSSSFVIAALNAEIIINLSSFLDEKQANRIVDASLSND